MPAASTDRKVVAGSTAAGTVGARPGSVLQAAATRRGLFGLFAGAAALPVVAVMLRCPLNLLV